MHKIAKCTKTKSSEELEIVHFDHASAWKASTRKVLDFPVLFPRAEFTRMNFYNINSARYWLLDNPLNNFRG